MVAGSRSPVAAFSRLRSSTEVSESKPASWKACSGWTAWTEAWPSTAATSVRTRSSTTCSRSASGSPANRCPSEPFGALCAARRTGATRTSPRRTGGTGCPCPSRNADVSSRIGASAARSVASAASNIRRPSAGGIAARPMRLMRVRSVWSRLPVMALSLSCAHRPQASDVARRPTARRCSARASRKVLAAA